MTSRPIYFLLLLSISFFSFGQDAKKIGTAKPKLVVGIVVDQMRNDYIYRYWDRYGNGGFKKLIGNGYYLRNAHYNYVPTITGPGHASIFTGATPKIHGIVANDWPDKNTWKGIYCTYDENIEPVGPNSVAKKRSPVNLLSTTIGDELKLSTNGKGKVFGVALKDRSAILPAGHAADGAFWFDDSTGAFISSSWYVKELPSWLNEFNKQQLAAAYLKKGWTTLKPIDTYTNSISDKNNYERSPNGKPEPVFPYEYSNYLAPGKYGMVKETPWGNTITKDLAIACLKNEKLGKDDMTDLLTISFSSPDLIAHDFGPRSVEVEDVYLRLDLELEELIKTLDAEVGAGNYVLFLTADHGGADVPNYLIDAKIPAGYFDERELKKDLKNYFQKTYGDADVVTECWNQQIFLNEQKLDKLNRQYVEQKLCDYLVTKEAIAEAFPSISLKNESSDKRDAKSLIQNGYNHQRSGNVAFALRPGWLDHEKTGTTHAASYSYDTHVPVIFYGSGIEKGSSLNYYTITQIAPTISDIIKINYPNGCVANPIDVLIQK
jgi:predicted AlkP superfamily pyrophosphatase or phosphodiesterase